MTNKPIYTNWKRNALRHLIVYAFDMSIAIAGWTWGFGLHVRNWWALIALLIFSRFVFHTLGNAFFFQEAKERWQNMRDAKAYFAERYYLEPRVNDRGEPLYPEDVE